MPLFEIKSVDRAFYEKRLRDFLPEHMIDVHTHVWRKQFISAAARKPLRRVSWPDRVAAECTVEQLVETYALMFPGKSVTPLMFTTLVGNNFEEANAYVERVARRHNFPALIFSMPKWSAEQLEQKIVAGGFLGAKSYLSLAEPYLPENEIRIFDFFPHHHLEVINRHGWILMLHIPRPGRLRDEVNLAQMIELEQRYPKIKVIVAHVGRAYCPGDVGNAFKVLAKTKKMRFDISANTNRTVFRQLIEAVGPKRILFGSDLPITRMRMARICERGNYVNIVPAGLYGDISGDAHMRAVRGAAAERLTFFMYEELDAFRQAAEKTGLSRHDLEDVFYNNAAELLAAARSKPPLPQLRMKRI
ncbi:MAG: amidohydrolase family protein [Lentisphaerae bacterium]|nr:amidohydrolase family protein [Lentisphaerota bacterium]